MKLRQGTNLTHINSHDPMDILTNPNDTSLNGMRVAILATDGFEESELRSPREALLEAGAFVDLVALELGAI